MRPHVKRRAERPDKRSMQAISRHRPVQMRAAGLRGWWRWVVGGCLIALTIWGGAYQLADTVFHSWATRPPFAGVWPDLPFVIAGVLLIARGVMRSGERGWVLVGIGALCWAAGDVYWSVNLATLSSPPVPSWADAGYLSFCPLTFAGIVLLVRKRVRRHPVRSAGSGDVLRGPAGPAAGRPPWPRSCSSRRRHRPRSAQLAPGEVGLALAKGAMRGVN
jgi:hypothetical protein